MATITVNNIPENLYQEIKKKAQYHRRSLNKEIIFCLESATGREPVDVDFLIDQARHLREKITFRISEFGNVLAGFLRSQKTFFGNSLSNFRECRNSIDPLFNLGPLVDDCLFRRGPNPSPAHRVVAHGKRSTVTKSNLDLIRKCIPRHDSPARFAGTIR